MESPVLQNVYVKDDFFDSLSCDALDRGSQNGRTKFSEQMRKDTEVYMCLLLKKGKKILRLFITVFRLFLKIF